MKKINVFCVLVLALMLIDMVVDLFFNTSDASVELKRENESFGFLLFAFSSHWWHLVLSWWLWSVSSSLS